jgi:hypothetical protein
MFKVLGSDGKEYGPVTLAELQQWIREGRVNQATLVQREGDSAWLPLGQCPESASLFGPPTVPPAPMPQSLGVPGNATSDRTAALAAVNAPGWGMLVSGVLGILWSLLQLALVAVNGVEANPMFKILQQRGQSGAEMAGFKIGLFAALAFGVVWAGFVVFAGLKLRRLESRGLVMTASILMMVPCFGTSLPVCLLSLPLGIWALVVINRAGVKEHFS